MFFYRWCQAFEWSTYCTKKLKIFLVSKNAQNVLEKIQKGYFILRRNMFIVLAFGVFMH